MRFDEVCVVGVFVFPFIYRIYLFLDERCIKLFAQVRRYLAKKTSRDHWQKKLLNKFQYRKYKYIRRILTRIRSILITIIEHKSNTNQK